MGTMKYMLKKKLYAAAMLVALSMCLGSLYQLSTDAAFAPPRNLRENLPAAVHNSLLNVPIGSLGPKGSDRHNMLYYDYLYLLTLKYGGTSKSLLEVGCAGDPFAQHLTWMNQKSCL